LSLSNLQNSNSKLNILPHKKSSTITHPEKRTTGEPVQYISSDFNLKKIKLKSHDLNTAGI
jgi:hypothetical protein